MYDARNMCGCKKISCIGITLTVLSVLLFFTVGAIVGAYAAELVVSSIVPFALLAVVLFIATLITAFFASCRCRNE